MRKLFLIGAAIAALANAQNAMGARRHAGLHRAADCRTRRSSGNGRLRYMMMDIYDAELFAPDGQYEPGKPVALRLTYLRNFTGAKIADLSAQEMRKEGVTDEVKLSAWYNQMRDIFPDVDDGTAVTGIELANGATEFYKDGKQIGAIDDPDFGPLFFGIWLGKGSSESELRADLLHLDN